jgi:hypothetical protein
MQIYRQRTGIQKFCLLSTHIRKAEHPSYEILSQLKLLIYSKNVAVCLMFAYIPTVTVSKAIPLGASKSLWRGDASRSWLCCCVLSQSSTFLPLQPGTPGQV